MSDAFLDAGEIRASTFVRYVELHQTLGSTNDRAAELARDANIELPGLVAARRQTAGRGRGDHKWSASDGALTFSLLFEPKIFRVRAEDWPKLALTAGVALCDALVGELAVGWAPPTRIDPATMVGGAHPTGQQFPSRVLIKWPNDVMLDGAKLAGILIESPGGPRPAKERVIMGIGINVNNSWRKPDSAAAGLARHREKPPGAITLCDATNRMHDPQQILVSILRALEARIGQLADHDRQLPDAWQQLCWLTEQDVEVQASTGSIEGICVGIDRDGSLLVEDEFRTHRIRSGSVRAL
jgi:BirA family biotin operon repressor/biotin-[acetyl-CoA-carboxylase] ligase